LSELILLEDPKNDLESPPIKLETKLRIRRQFVIFSSIGLIVIILTLSWFTFIPLYISAMMNVILVIIALSMFNKTAKSIYNPILPLIFSVIPLIIAIISIVLIFTIGDSSGWLYW